MDEKNDYEFVEETIKKKPINKRKLVHKLGMNIVSGLIIGFVACFIIAIFFSRINDKVNPEEEPNLVTIPEDEEHTDADTDEIDESSSELYIEGQTGALNNSGEGEIDFEDPDVEGSEGAEDTDNPDETEKVTEENAEMPDEPAPATIINQIVEKDLDIEDYKLLYRKIGDVANQAKRSLATVSCSSNDTDWFMNDYEVTDSVTGVIVADNGKELLIIANMTGMDSSKEIKVTFCNDVSFAGSIKKTDPNTGLCVVAVDLESLNDATKNSIAMAKLGNSSIATLTGTPVMAVGSPLGVNGSMSTGLVTSNSRIIEFPDLNLRYLTTDIYGSTEGSGVIIDFEGKVMGIIFQGGASNDTKNLIHAYAISDIKQTIEKISNGQDVAYLGIIGTDVTKDARDNLNVPEGAYVKQVVIDSPAMRGGIQNGDVIVKLGTQDIKSFRDYKDAMMKCQPGDTTMITVKRPSKEGYVEFSYEIELEALK